MIFSYTWQCQNIILRSHKSYCKVSLSKSNETSPSINNHTLIFSVSCRLSFFWCSDHSFANCLEYLIHRWVGCPHMKGFYVHLAVASHTFHIDPGFESHCWSHQWIFRPTIDCYSVDPIAKICILRSNDSTVPIWKLLSIGLGPVESSVAYRSQSEWNKRAIMIIGISTFDALFGLV